MYKVVLRYEDGTEDEIYTSDWSEVEELQNNEDYAYVETV